MPKPDCYKEVLLQITRFRNEISRNSEMRAQEQIEKKQKISYTSYKFSPSLLGWGMGRGAASMCTPKQTFLKTSKTGQILKTWLKWSIKYHHQKER
jgi:hypothetical protein